MGSSFWWWMCWGDFWEWNYKDWWWSRLWPLGWFGYLVVVFLQTVEIDIVGFSRIRWRLAIGKIQGWPLRWFPGEWALTPTQSSTYWCQATIQSLCFRSLLREDLHLGFRRVWIIHVKKYINGLGSYFMYSMDIIKTSFSSPLMGET